MSAIVATFVRAVTIAVTGRGASTVASGVPNVRRIPAFMLVGALIVTSWTFAAAAHAVPSQVGERHPASLAELRGEARALSQQLAAAIARYRESLGGNRDTLLAQITATARARRQLLVDLLESDPATVLETALPARLAYGMPGAVAALLESRVELEGTLKVLHVDYDDDSLSHFEYALSDSSGNRVSVFFTGEPPRLRSGGTVRAKGVLLPGEDGDDEGALVVGAEAGSIVLLADGGTDSVAASLAGPQLDHTLGAQHTLVLLFNFLDNATSMPWSIAQVDEMVFSEVSDFYSEASYGQTWSTGDVHGWFTVPIVGTCDNWAIADAADQEALGAGVDLSVYDRIVYLYPHLSICGYAGLGEVGSFPSRAWINGYLQVNTISHELGHNLGLWHAHMLDCGPSVVEEPCSYSEYGDIADVMGGAWGPAHFNPYFKQLMGWLDYEVSPPITEVTSDGTYTLGAYEINDDTPKALRVLRSIDPATGERTWYYVESRKVIGTDAFLADHTNVTDGVMVRRAVENDGNSSYMLDTTPDSSTTVDGYDPALTAGQTFSDAQAGITVTTLAVDATGATVDVHFSAPICTPAEPGLVLSPSDGPWVAPGTPVNYTVTVTNYDGAVCAAATFDLAAAVPSGWGSRFGSATLVLAPGASDQTDLTVTSGTAAADGFYDITVTAARGETAAMSAVTYIVSAPTGNSPPVAADDEVVIEVIQPITIDVLGNDSDPDGNSLSVIAVEQGNKGDVVINADNTVSYAPGKRFKNSDSFTYTISDGASSASAMVTIDSASGGGGGGGKGNGKGGGKL